MVGVLAYLVRNLMSLGDSESSKLGFRPVMELMAPETTLTIGWRASTADESHWKCLNSISGGFLLSQGSSDDSLCTVSVTHLLTSPSLCRWSNEILHSIRQLSGVSIGPPRPIPPCCQRRPPLINPRFSFRFSCAHAFPKSFKSCMAFIMALTPFQSSKKRGGRSPLTFKAKVVAPTLDRTIFDNPACPSCGWR